MALKVNAGAVLWITVRSTEKPDDPKFGEFRNFLINNDLLPVHALQFGGGVCDGLFNLEQGEKVLEWLKANGWNGESEG